MGAWVAALTALGAPSRGAKLVDVRTVDDEHVMVHVLDGEVRYKDDGRGPGAMMGHESAGGDVVVRYDPPMDIEAARATASYTITSKTDARYAAGLRPVAVFRKSKVNGTNNRWPEADYTVEHTLFLRLPRKLQQGKDYTLTIAGSANIQPGARGFAFDFTRSLSEAIHVNIIGYHPGLTPSLSADLYAWMGDGGARDYTAYVGKRVFLVDPRTGKRTPVGTVRFWKAAGKDFGGWNLTASPVWTCDASGGLRPGSYRLAVEGIGCSREFRIDRDAYREPYRTSVRGFFYMRIGAEPNVKPIPRQPRFIPGKDPANFRVYRTTMGPWHPDWRKLGGDPWDNTDWSRYKEPGEPTNPNAWGGHSDACDWDRNPTHISIIWDMLLPYLLSNGKLAEDNLGIPESGNGIPDLIDEARYEVDLWLRLRDGKGGYASGLNNPTKDHSIMYQGAARPYMAWASAANCAMLADCFRIARKPDLMARYRDAAIEAWKTANEEDLDLAYNIGDTVTRGRDLKMMAAASLYNVTGERRYEDVMAELSVVAQAGADIDAKDRHCQIWSTATYLMCAKFGWRPIHHPDLAARMRETVVREATAKNVEPTRRRPSRRSSSEAYGWWQTRQDVHLACIAHAIAADAAQRQAFARALVLEADYGLGRNPMNMVQMTGLGSRHVDDIYTSGRNDGTPGVHPGHTPYMNLGPWGQGFMFDPGWYARKGYPSWDNWPHGEGLWPARYCFANNEFTPQQTMRGKMCLLAYLYAIR